MPPLCNLMPEGSLQIGQLQEFAHHGGQAVHLPLDDLEQLQCGLGAEVLLFAEQADSGLEDSQWSTKFMDSIL